jgi:hypothetical protein
MAKERPSSLTHGSEIRAGFARMTGKVAAFFRTLPKIGRG